jgi:Tol biopolymer transport system component
MSENRTTSERLVAQIDSSSWLQESFKVSPNGRRMACAARVGNKRCVVVDGKEEEQYDDIGGTNLLFSPDSKRFAYKARTGNSYFVVVDGKVEKQYDSIMNGSPIFSPDSRRVACGVERGNRRFVVVDGKEGQQYDAIVSIGGGGIFFDS